MKTYSCRITRAALTLAFASLLLGTATVHAGEDGFYFGADAGVNFSSDLESTLGGGSTSFNPGVRVNLFTGYAFRLCDQFSIAPELEAGCIYNSFNKGVGFNGQSTSGGGNMTQVPVVASVILNWHFAPKWNAYGGVGLGADYVNVSVSSSSPLILATTEGGINWQLKAGIEYKLGPGDLGLGYQYLGNSIMWYNPMANHTVMASYTIHF